MPTTPSWEASARPSGVLSFHLGLAHACSSAGSSPCWASWGCREGPKAKRHLSPPSLTSQSSNGDSQRADSYLPSYESWCSRPTTHLPSHASPPQNQRLGTEEWGDQQGLQPF